MKKIALAALYLSFGYTLKAEEQEKTIKSNIKTVTVFLTGAEIERKASFSAAAGYQTLVLTDLSQFIDPNTIQVSGKGNFVILGVDFKRNYLNKSSDSPKIKLWRDSVNYYNTAIEENNQLLDVFKLEKEMIISNKVIKGSNQSMEPSKLAELSEFYRKRLKDINLKTLNLQRKNKKYTHRAQILNNQISQLTSKLQKVSGEIYVTISTKNSVNGQLMVKYKVANCGWVPSYDIRSRSLAEKIEITYKASVYQTTGVDWKNVDLTFSTGNPNLSNQKPELYPWYLNYYTTYKKSKAARARTSAQLQELTTMEVISEEEDNNGYADDNSVSLSSFTETVTNLVNSEFKMGVKLSVKSDGKKQIMEIDKYNLEAAYSYYAVPKLEKNAFLLAKITGWEELSLLPGQVNLYNNGTYVGKSYLDPAQTQDTLSVSLGRDQNIIVKRKMAKDFTKNVVIGGNRKITKAYEIEIKNAKSNTIEIEVVDQIPISKIQSIEVSLNEEDGAKYDQKTGFLTWKLTIPAGGTIKKKFSFTVKYPKDKKISNL